MNEIHVHCVFHLFDVLLLACVLSQCAYWAMAAGRLIKRSVTLAINLAAKCILFVFLIIFKAGKVLLDLNTDAHISRQQ